MIYILHLTSVVCKWWFTDRYHSFKIKGEIQSKWSSYIIHTCVHTNFVKCVTSLLATRVNSSIACPDLFLQCWQIFSNWITVYKQSLIHIILSVSLECTLWSLFKTFDIGYHWSLELNTLPCIYVGLEDRFDWIYPYLVPKLFKNWRAC